MKRLSYFSKKQLMVFGCFFSFLQMYSQGNIPNKEMVKNVENKKSTEDVLPQKTIEYYVDAFNQKGLEIESKELTKLSMTDLQIIDKHDFNVYRNEKTTREVKIVNGPTIKLKSIQDLSTQKLNKDIIQYKSKEDLSSLQKPLITQLDLGLGRTPVDGQELWQSK